MTEVKCSKGLGVTSTRRGEAKVSLTSSSTAQLHTLCSEADARQGGEGAPALMRSGQGTNSCVNAAQ